MRARWLPAVSLCLTAGCSFMGLDDIELPPCQDDEECVPLSLHEGYDSSCRKHVCRQGECVPHRDGDEAHDGWDNDCDGLIDEPGVAEQQTIVPSGTTGVENVKASARMDFSHNSDDGLAVAWSDPDSGAGRFALLDSTNLAVKQMSYLRSQDETELNSYALEPDCHRLRDDGSVRSAECNLTEVAVGLTARPAIHHNRAVLVASVNSRGCAAGQLRLGYFELEPELQAKVILRGPLRRSNSYLGVDLTDDGACTGGSRAGCSSEATSCGLARPAMVVIDREGHPPQALVAWIGDHNRRGQCGGEAAPVEVIGAFLETSVLEGGFGWVTATNEAVPQRLGQTGGGGRPGAAVLPGQGCFVGYGNEDGGLALHFVPVLPDPPEYDGFTCCVAGDEREECEGEPVCSGPEDRTGLETEPIGGVIDFEAIEAGAGGPVDHVAISLGTVDEGSVELGLAWLEGCGSGTEAIVFRRLVLDVDGGAPGEIVEVGPAERLVRRGEGLGPPALAYWPEGFVNEGFARDGSREATDHDLGGWLAAWAEESGEGGTGRVIARRVLELDGHALDEQERIELTQMGVGAEVDARAPFLYTSESGVRFIYHDRANGVLVSGDVMGHSSLP